MDKIADHIKSNRIDTPLKSIHNNYGVFDKMMEGVQVINREWQYIYLNDAAVSHSKLSKELLIGHKMMRLYPEIEKTEVFLTMVSVMNTRIPKTMTNKFEFPDGSFGYFDLYMEPIDVGIIILSFDVTQQKLNEQKLEKTNHLLKLQTKKLIRQSDLLKKSLDEKTALIKEIHHRVKNNLQLIISLINLQSDQIEDESLKTVFQSFESKINAMAIVHNMLNSKENLLSVDLSVFINNLVHYISARHKKTTIDLNIDVVLNQKCVNIDTAISFGLLLNEILTNAIKFGSKENACSISIHLRDDEQQHFILKIEDHGKGIPEKVLANYKDFLGLCLIDDLIDQLDGTYQRNSNDKGTYYDITFSEIHKIASAA